ncbi:hypothetical protein LCGC14_2792290 [marine sediment metagenome]|uniref:Methyltransferase type 12 domain-containing protein n=1 Tax=marine sediment metagenome TaxID=412755 RepID=A0A0F9BGK0_9ZZZZ
MPTIKNPPMTAEEYATQEWIPKRGWRHLRGPKHQARFAEIARHLEGETFLDVGCACGHSTEILARMKPGHWTGFDFSESMIAKATELVPSFTNITVGRFQCGDGSAAVKPFRHVKDFEALATCPPADSVVCSEVIEHVMDDKGLVAALWAVTGKVLVLTTPNRYIVSPGHHRVYTATDLRDFIAPHADRDGGTFKIYSKGDFFYVVCRKEAG